MKFATDRSLGKLAKWLRILGYDTLYYTGDADRTFLNKVRAEGRIALTRKREMGKKQFMGEMLVLSSDRVEGQLREVDERFHLRPDEGRLFSRCLECNELLAPIAKEKVRERVPVYTFATQEQFMVCPHCGKVFWAGSHKERMEGLVRKRIPSDRP